jgi:hypothetical protein
MSYKPIPGYPGYEVSDRGRVRSLKKGGRLLRPIARDNNRSHPSVHLIQGGVCRHEYIHRLVLLAFVGPCPKGMQARHYPRRNGNRLENLSWATPLVNQKDRDEHGTHNKGRGAKLTVRNVRAIRRVKAWPYGTVIKLARKYGVSHAAIQYARDRKSWRHL